MRFTLQYRYDLINGVAMRGRLMGAPQYKRKG